MTDWNGIEIEPIHSKDGKIYWVDSGDKLYIQRLQGGQYQKGNWYFAKTLIQSTRTAIDIGSNNACNAINYADTFEWVECFEPTFLAQDLWSRTVKDNSVDNVTLHTNALGETQDSVEMLLQPHNGGHNHLAHFDKNPRSKPETSVRETQPVKMLTLDEFEFEDIDFIKIDVEGYEYFVLQGAQKTINKYRPILQLEIVAGQCWKFNYRAEDMIEWLRSQGFRVASKRDGWLEGEFKSVRGNLHYNGYRRRGDMDLFFVPEEYGVTLDPKLELFAQ